jgi:hypothetical protein
VNRKEKRNESLDAIAAREGKGMRHSENRGWLWLAGSAALVALVMSLPAHANAQTITICLTKSGLIKAIQSPCPGNTTAVSWQEVGPTGPTGPTGPAGPEGAQGQQGPVGVQGPNGPTGVTGNIGSAGPIGEPGIPGGMGPTGPQGDQGGPGEANPVSGEGGIIGPTGPTGIAGATGPTGPTGFQGPTGIHGANTEDVVVLSGGTLGATLGTLANIQVNPGESDTVGIGNGAEQQGHLQAETFVPIPANPVHPTEGVLQDFHFTINPGPGGPGGSGGTYNFSVVDLTHPIPGGTTFICSITQGLVTAGANGTNSTACPDPAHPGSCSCEDDEQSNPAGHIEIVGVNPGDSIAVTVTTNDATAPTNAVNVRFTMNYIHDDQI